MHICIWADQNHYSEQGGQTENYNMLSCEVAEHIKHVLYV